MSDKYVQGSPQKRHAAELLGMVEPQDSVFDHLPPALSLPPDPLTKTNKKGETYPLAEKIAFALQAAGVKLLKPRVYSALTEVENPAKNPDFVAAHPTILHPSSTKVVIPEHRDHHTIVPYNRARISQMLFQATVDPDHPDTPARARLAHEVFQLLKTTALTSGTYSGQIERLKAMADIRYGLHGKNGTRDLDADVFANANLRTYEDFARILDANLPLYPLDDDHPGLTKFPSQYIEADSLKDYLPPLGRLTLAGPPFLGKKKGEVLPDALAWADYFVEKVNAILVEAKTTLDKQALKKGGGAVNSLDDTILAGLQTLLSEDQDWYFRLGIVFPKMERYDVTKILQKTRNIYSMPLVTHLLLGTPGKWFSDHMLTYLNSGIKTKSLAHFSPFHGGLDKILAYTHEQAISAPHRMYSLIYADNWYLYVHMDDGTPNGEDQWFSVDLEKAEAHVTQDRARVMCYYILTRLCANANGERKFNASWATIMLRLMPLAIADAIALMGNQQFIFPGLATGVSLTFAMNHFNSSLLDHLFYEKYLPNATVLAGPEKGRPTECFTERGCTPLIEEYLPSNDPDSRFQKFLKKYGFNAKVELHQPRLGTRLRDAMEAAINKPKAWYLGNPVEEHAPVDPDIVELDLLGWDAIASEYLESFVPVLHDGRLLPSFALPSEVRKSTYDLFVGVSHTSVDAALEVVRCEATRMVGGFAHTLLDDTLRASAESKRAVVDRAELLLSKITGSKMTLFQIASEINEFANDIGPGFALNEPMTSETLVRLNSGEGKQAPDGARIKHALLRDLYRSSEAGSLGKRAKNDLAAAETAKLRLSRAMRVLGNGDPEIAQESIKRTLDYVNLKLGPLSAAVVNPLAPSSEQLSKLGRSLENTAKTNRIIALALCDDVEQKQMEKPGDAFFEARANPDATHDPIQKGKALHKKVYIAKENGKRVVKRWQPRPVVTTTYGGFGGFTAAPRERRKKGYDRGAAYASEEETWEDSGDEDTGNLSEPESTYEVKSRPGKKAQHGPVLDAPEREPRFRKLKSQ